MTTSAPYREAEPLTAQYLCIVCLRTATVDEAGACDCSAPPSPRLALTKVETLDVLRNAVDKRWNRSLTWITVGALAASLLVTFVICQLMGWSFEPHKYTGPPTMEIAIGLFLLFGTVGAVTLVKAKPKTVGAMLAYVRVRVVDGASSGKA